MRSPLLVVLLLPAMEIGLLALFAARYGLGAVAIEVFASSLIGVVLLRRAGYRNLVALNARLQQAQDAPEKIVRDLLSAVSGVLLIIPGIATDLVGTVLLLPSVRERLARSWTASGKIFRYQGGPGAGPAGMYNRPHGPPGSTADEQPEPERPDVVRHPRGGNVIEGEFTREDD